MKRLSGFVLKAALVAGILPWVALGMVACSDDDGTEPDRTSTTSQPTATPGATQPSDAVPTKTGLCPDTGAPFDVAAKLNEPGAALCAIWRDDFDDEDGYRIKVFYFEAEVTDTFDFPANSVEMVLSDVLRPIETPEECRRYRDYQTELWVVIDGEEQFITSIATSLEGCPGVDNGME